MGIESDALEEWKDISGYEGIYMISDHGAVKKLKREWLGGNGGKRVSEEKIFKPHYSKYGYNHCILIKDGKPKDVRVCRMVALHFVANPENKPRVNHLDGNKANDYYKNLEWSTASENDIHAYANGLRFGMKGEKNGMANLTEAVILNIRKDWADGISNKDLAIKYNRGSGVISTITKRRTWKHI